MIATWGGQPILTLAQRKPVDPLKPLDRAIADLRGSLGDSDRVYFDEVVARIRATGSLSDFASVGYPLVNWGTALKNAMAAGWNNGDGWVMSALKQWTTTAWRAHAKQWQANPLYDILAPTERRLVPHEAIANYVRDRIPPLRHDVELKRRELCRDIVAEETKKGSGIRETMTALDREGFGRSQWHRENIARTETATLYSHGRAARMGASSSVVGYRFVAIMDDRTSAICRGLHGKEFKIGDAATRTPPCHYQCRSQLQPIFAWEKAEWADVSDTPQPLPGFGKFDFTQIHQPDVTEFLRPLKDSQIAEVRSVVADLESYLGRPKI